MSLDVQNLCEKCATYNQHKPSKRNHGPLTPIYTGEPFKRVAMDIIGPLLRTALDNRYILTVVDYFTNMQTLTRYRTKTSHSWSRVS